jgi:hypothetical protein
MQLIDALNAQLAQETSMFRAQLLREDIARLAKLDALAKSSTDAEQYRGQGRRLGWTAQDARTHELGAPLDRLLDAVRDLHAEPRPDDAESRVREAWQELTRVRMDRLTGCLSTRVPGPGE